MEVPVQGARQCVKPPPVYAAVGHPRRRHPRNNVRLTDLEIDTLRRESIATPLQSNLVMCRNNELATGMPDPTVTVIIPNFNHGDVLGRAVAAHCAQTLQPFEILIVDDCSTDNSVEVAQALCRQHSHIRLIRRPVNGGPNAAINTGLAEAQGEFVAFSAADDIVDLEFLRRSVETLCRFPEAAFSFLDPSRVLVGPGRTEHVPMSFAEAPHYFDPDEFERLFRFNQFTISSNTVVYRRDAISSIGGFRADLEWQADWMANLVLAFRHGVAYIPEALAHFIVNPDSYGERKRPNADQRRLFLHCMDVIEREFPDVAVRFRRTCSLPTMRMRSLLWLAESKSGRHFISFRLFHRALLQEIWTGLRPLTPMGVRRMMRRLVARI